MVDRNHHVITTHGLSKHYGDVQALKSLDLSVPKNAIFGFLGPNGAGKTTAMKILLGLAKPTGGSGEIFGKDILTESLAIRERIGYLPQQPRFIDYMTARELLGFTCRFFFRGSDRQFKHRVEEMIELVGLENKADRPVKGFSGGEKQRLGIALAQINAPDLLILDEPAAALDPLGRHQVLDIMSNLRQHTTIFYSTHILDDVQKVSDTVAILNNGSLVAQGPIEALLNNQNETIYQITFKGTPPTLEKRMMSLPWVTWVKSFPHVDGSDSLEIAVNNEKTAEDHLLRSILRDQQVVVKSFQRKKYELEEVFMDIVKGSEQ